MMNNSPFTRNLMVFCAGLALALMQWGSSSLQADTLILTNGKTVDGQIISRANGKIKVGLSFGTMTFSESQVREVKGGPAPQSFGTSGSADSVGGTASRKGKWKDLKGSLKGILAEMEDLPLEPWEQESSEVVYGPEGKYKVDRYGSVEYVNDKPQNADGISRLYALQNPSGFSYVGTEQGRQYVWQRLYWDAKDKNWQPTSPAQSNFIKDQGKAQIFMSKLAEAYDDPYRLVGLVSSLSRNQAQGERRDYAQEEKQLAEMREAAAKIGESWGGTELIKAVCDIEIRLSLAGVDQKVSLAYERRELLKRIADSVDR